MTGRRSRATASRQQRALVSAGRGVWVSRALGTLAVPLPVPAAPAGYRGAQRRTGETAGRPARAALNSVLIPSVKVLPSFPPAPLGGAEQRGVGGCVGAEAAPEIIPRAGGASGAAGRHRSPAAPPRARRALPAAESPDEVSSSCLFASPRFLLPPSPAFSSPFAVFLLMKDFLAVSRRCDLVL